MRGSATTSAPAPTCSCRSKSTTAGRLQARTKALWQREYDRCVRARIATAALGSPTCDCCRRSSDSVAADWDDAWEQYMDPFDPPMESKHVYDDEF